jgi:glyoxylase-like metal-dependent hydrolase (beta-lactamase superfamily II)
MREVADDVFHLPLAPRDAVNAYLVGDVLVDAGTSFQAGRLLARLRGRTVAEHVLTHAHVDHAGGTRRVVDALGVQVRAGAQDLPALHAGRSEVRLPGILHGLGMRATAYPAVPEATALPIGETVGPGFVVLDTPGHSAGHVSLWRERDGVLICGDVINSMSLLTTRPGLQEPPDILTPDPARNRESIRTLAELGPRTILVGHGPVVRDATASFRDFAAGLQQP